MTPQTPEGDPPPEPPTASPPGPPAPDADAETARVPLEPAPTPAHGLISAAPVGWVGPERDAPNPADPNAPEVAWAPPAAATAATAAPMVGAGLVIAGVFTRVVAYVIDVALLGTAGIAVGLLLGVYDQASNVSVAWTVSLVFIGVEAIYFVGLWRSGGQGTIGMRLLGLRLVRAADATTVAFDAAVIRWFALSGAVSIFALAGSGNLGLLWPVWLIILLFTTAADRLHRGLHDRWARSVVVQPAPGGSGAAVVGCLVLAGLALVVPVVILVVASERLQEILIEVGNSI